MKLKKADMIKVLKEDDGVTKLSEMIMSEYNECLDNIIRNLDSNTIMKHFMENQKIGAELDAILNKVKHKKKSGWLSGMFEQSEKEKVMSIKQKVDALLKKYKECYSALKSSIDAQTAKGIVMEHYSKYFIEIESMLGEYLPTLKQETLQEKIVVSGITTLLKNIKKMSITMQQKMSVMQGAIISSMGLKEEMGTAMFHFESLIKDMMISVSLDNIIKSSAEMINVFRGTIEKYQHKLAEGMIENAEEISNIRMHGVVSVQALNDMTAVIDVAKDKFTAMAIEHKKNNDATMKSLGLIQEKSNELNRSTENYLLPQSIGVKN